MKRGQSLFGRGVHKHVKAVGGRNTHSPNPLSSLVSAHGRTPFAAFGSVRRSHRLKPGRRHVSRSHARHSLAWPPEARRAGPRISHFRVVPAWEAPGAGGDPGCRRSRPGRKPPEGVAWPEKHIVGTQGSFTVVSPKCGRVRLSSGASPSWSQAGGSAAREGSEGRCGADGQAGCPGGRRMRARGQVDPATSSWPRHPESSESRGPEGSRWREPPGRAPRSALWATGRCVLLGPGDLCLSPAGPLGGAEAGLRVKWV